MTSKTASARATLARNFTPVPVRSRHDGWTADRQAGFIQALAATASVAAAAKSVGMGVSSAYELRTRGDAEEFREAWQLALDHAVQNLADAALDRAINGVANPIFFKGEQIGERRVYNERLTMFLLRMRDPERFGRWREDRTPLAMPDSLANRLHVAVLRVRAVALGAVHGIQARLGPRPDGPVMMARKDAEEWATAQMEAMLDGVSRQNAVSEPDLDDDELEPE